MIIVILTASGRVDGRRISDSCSYDRSDRCIW